MAATQKFLKNYLAGQSTDWTPRRGGSVIIKEHRKLEMGILRGTGQNTIQYYRPRTWNRYLDFLRGDRSTLPHPNWIHQSTQTRRGSDKTWRVKVAPYPTDGLTDKLSDTITEIQQQLEQHGRRNPIDLF